jgi:hypothetical protein
VFVLSFKSITFEMSAVTDVGSDLWTKRLDREIISPDLTVIRVTENLSFERRFIVDTYNEV